MRVVDKKLMHQRYVTLLGAKFGYVLTVHQDLTRCDRIKPRHKFDKRGFTSTRFTQKNIKMARLKQQISWFYIRLTANNFGNIL